MKLRVLSILLMALVAAACGAGAGTPTPLPTVVLGGGSTTPQASSPGLSGGVTASGIVVPAQETRLAFASGGRLDMLPVAVGDQVQAGQVLARLAGGETLTAAAASAQLELLNARQALQELQDSAALVAAQAQLAVANAHDALAKAQSELYSAQHPAARSLYDAVAQAQLALQTAQANRQLANVDPKVSAYNNAVFVTNYYRRRWEEAKDKYEQSNGNTDAKNELDQAWVDYQTRLNDQLALELQINTARANQDDAVSQAQAAYDQATENLNNALAGPDANRLALAQAKVAVAEAAWADTQARYAKVKAGPDPDQLALTQARLASAQAQAAAAQSAVEDLELRAPFGGMIAALQIHAGEWVTPGQPVLLLSDLQHLLVETTDLSERDIPRIEIGQPVIVTIQALNEDVAGRVSAISPLADTLGGDVVYKTTVALDTRPSGVRAGMSAEVLFGTGP